MSPQRNDLGTGPTTLLLIDLAGPPRLTVLCNRRWVRIVARVRSSSLDRRLADGCPPEASRLLSARAQVLVSAGTRRALAQSWDNILAHALKAPAVRCSRVRLNRRGIIACERYIQEMQNLLLTPQPIPARGTAMMSCLLGNGMGPLYDRRSPGDLAAVLRETIAQLDPTVSL
jgi:hypothetical protein